MSHLQRSTAQRYERANTDALDSSEDVTGGTPYDANAENLPAAPATEVGRAERVYVKPDPPTRTSMRDGYRIQQNDDDYDDPPKFTPSGDPFAESRAGVRPAKSGCRDAPWALLFIAAALFIGYLACTKGITEMSRFEDPNGHEVAVTNNEASQQGYMARAEDPSQTQKVEYTEYGPDSQQESTPQHKEDVISFNTKMLSLLVAAGAATIGSMALLHLAFYSAEALIQFGLWSMCVMVSLMACVSILNGDIVMALLFAVLTGFTICFAVQSQARIPFAAANLRCACVAVKKHKGTILVGIMSVPVMLMWLTMSYMALAGVFLSNNRVRQEGVYPVPVEFLMNEDDDNGQYYKSAVAWENIPGDPTACYTIINGTYNTFCMCQHGKVVFKDSCDFSAYFANELTLNLGVYFFLMLVVYWGFGVVKNTVHVTASGVVASWWYGRDKNSTTVVQSALCRAVGPSFGSICLGSLLVAILQAIRWLVRMLEDQARREGDGCGASLLCMCECLIGCIESWLEYFNQWAYTYCAIYGDDFASAGNKVIQLFNWRGWQAITSDILAENALSFAAIGLALGAAMVAMILGWFMPMYGASGMFCVSAGIVTFIVVSCITAVLNAAIMTIIVCFCEDPRPMKEANPKEFADLWENWKLAWGDIMERCRFVAFLDTAAV